MKRSAPTSTATCRRRPSKDRLRPARRSSSWSHRLAAESIGCGTCAIGAYDQERMDTALGVDRKEDFTVHMAPVGRVD